MRILNLVSIFLLAAMITLAGCGHSSSDSGSLPFQDTTDIQNEDTQNKSSSLPPDPGEAGLAILAGIDSDEDGVRDDVQRYIVQAYPNSEKTRKAVTQLAISVQDTLLSFDDKGKALDSANAMFRAIDCLFYVRPDDAYEVSSKLKAEILNTYDRSLAYLKADSLLSGESFLFAPKKEWENSCNFNPDELSN